MSDWTTAILPLRIATSFRPSIPEAGSMTRPPSRSRSKVVLTDMADLLSPWAAIRAAPNCEAYFVFSYTTIRAIDSFKFMQGRHLAPERFDGWKTHLKKRKPVV